MNEVQELIEKRNEVMALINEDAEIAAIRKQYVEMVQAHELYEVLNDLNEMLEEYDEDADGAIDESTPAGKEVPGAESDAGAEKYVKQVNGKWALVSRKTGRPLKYFASKPSREEADRALRAVEYFKHG